MTPPQDPEAWFHRRATHNVATRSALEPVLERLCHEKILYLKETPAP